MKKCECRTKKENSATENEISDIRPIEIEMTEEKNRLKINAKKAEQFAGILFLNYFE